MGNKKTLADDKSPTWDPFTYAKGYDLSSPLYDAI